MYGFRSRSTPKIARIAVRMASWATFTLGEGSLTRHGYLIHERPYWTAVTIIEKRLWLEYHQPSVNAANGYTRAD